MSNEKEKEALTNSTDGNEKLDGSADGKIGADDDSPKGRFIKGANGDHEAKIEYKPEPDAPFVGLTKDQLQEYATDPYWIRVRWVLLILFWVVWFGMLIAAILIIVFAEKCPPRPKQEWWEKSVVYQCYPRSFKDMNGDGVGDLKGVEDELDYVHKKLNASAVMLNPVYPSMDKDNGYDITDYKDIHPLMGNMEDFHSLKVAMHKRGMKLIMDFVPNHTSKNHTWFKESRKGGADNKYKDYYVWHDGNAGGPPNNWRSVMGGSAWTFDEERQQYYLHQFFNGQPDLNLTNADVKKELEEVLRFWLDKGVDGFRIDASVHLIENENMEDEEVIDASNDDYDSLNHTQTMYQPGTFELISEWRSLLDDYNKDGDTYRFLIAEAYTHGRSTEEVANLYEYNGKKVADMPTNMNLMRLDDECDGNCVHHLLMDWHNSVPVGGKNNWVIGNHDNARVASRVSQARLNAVLMLQMTLPGTPITYYGDEIGMETGDIDWSEARDRGWGPDRYAEKSRDGARTPMQWSDAHQAGFTTSDDPWLPVNEDYTERNVQHQFADGAGITNIEMYQQLTMIRQQPSFQWGDFNHAFINEHIFSYVRQAERFDGYAVAINFGTSTQRVDLVTSAPGRVPKQAKIVAHAADYSGTGASDYKLGDVINLNSFMLKPNEGLVFEWEWGKQDETATA